MVSWLRRRRRRLVRLHLEEREGIVATTIEGVLDGRVDGRYVLLVPKLVIMDGQTRAVDGTLEVPGERVVYVQVLG